ncbi:MAG TPA: glycosyltransferase [Acidimicrobiales bacterium]|nr:glycosyltransferase [Acidimicrobiales bacterium]
MRILVWHVHGSWLNSFVQGPHTYLVPVLPDRSSDGFGRARTWDWPATTEELSPEALRSADIDMVVAQRPRQLDRLIHDWTGRRPGTDVPCVYVEHNTPPGPADATPHPASGRAGVTIVHVTHFNQMMWDNGASPTTVIEHGVVDPGHLYGGELARAVAVINDPVTRNRVTGTDVVLEMRRSVDVDLFGMRSEPLGGTDVPQWALHPEMARRRVYLHPNRWTSLGLSLIEAMHLGMPVVAVGATEVYEAVPPAAGVVSNRRDVLESALRRFVHDPEEAKQRGDVARQIALERFGLKRFLRDWDRLLEEVVR